MRYFLTSILFLAACGDASDDFDQPASDQNEHREPVSGVGSDVDGDGYRSSVDCDDTNANVNPGEEELCANGIDDDCDDVIDQDGVNLGDYCYDEDGDGYCQDYDEDGDIDGDDIVLLCNTDDINAERIVDQTGGDVGNVDNYIEVEYGPLPTYAYPDPDCDDADATVYPDAAEVCDGQFNDCNDESTWTSADESSLMTTFYADDDGDTYGDAGSSTAACEASTGWVANDDDCNDTDSAINPTATEVCDSVDNDCDGDIDEGVLTTFYADADSDGQGNASSTVAYCSAPAGYVGNATDCNDSDSSIYLGAPETCGNDGIDNDCDGSSSDTPSDVITRYYDGDSDSYGDASDSFTSCSTPSGYVADATDCNDTDATIHPGAGDDGSDGIDNDCDGLIDEDPCVWTLTMDSNNGEPDSFIADVSEDASLSGEWYPASVSGVSVTATPLGATSWELVFTMDLCQSTSGMTIVDSYFPDGTSLADDASAVTHGDQDGDTFTITRVDPDGDLDFSRQITR